MMQARRWESLHMGLVAGKSSPVALTGHAPRSDAQAANAAARGRGIP
jgi:hypothetical protein